MGKLIILAMLVLVTGCAPTMKMIVNGHAYPTKWVKTVGEVEESTLKEKNASLATVNSNNGKGGAITIAYINTQYLPKGDTVTTISGMGNRIFAKLTFSQKVEMVKKRNGVDEKFWLRDVLNPVFKENPLVYEACKTYWTSNHTVSSAEKNIVYSVADPWFFPKDFKNFSVITDFTTITIAYTDKTKELPLDDVCSVRSAEFYLADIAKAAAARTEEYINK